MKLSYTRLGCLLAGLAGLGHLASAQTIYTPVAVASCTAAVLANGVGAAATSTSTAFDRGVAGTRFVLANTTFVNGAGQRPGATQALPASGLINSATTTGLTFQMAPAAGSNSLRIDGAGSGIPMLVTPQSCPGIMLLASEGNGTAAAKSFTVTFTGGASQAFAAAVPD